MNSPIFVLGCHKSGTTLIRNLLDGTPDVFAIPIETHFFQHLGFWVAYELMYSLPEKLSFEEVVNRLYTEIQESNGKPGYQMKWGDSFIPGSWDVSRFRDYLYDNGQAYFESNDIKAFFDCFVEAMHISLFGAPPRSCTRFIEKSVENAEFAALIKSLYPDAKFIHVVRNPYATLVSLRKFKYLVRNHYPFVGPLTRSMENSYHYLYHNQTHISDYLVIRFEDLLTDPNTIMRKVANFCGVDFDEIMLRPTFLNGKDWSGNSMSERYFKGISTHPINSWEKDISNMETEIVNQLFPHVLQDYGYKKVENTGSMWAKNKRESIQNYLANRFFLKSTGYSRNIDHNLRKERYAKYS